MPLVLVAVGLAFLISAIRGTLQKDDGTGLLNLLQKDFTGDGNFLAWILAITLVGSVGYIKELRPVSNAFLVLILLMFLLVANKGGKDFFTSLTNQVLSRSTSINPLTDPSSNLGVLGQFIPR